MRSVWFLGYSLKLYLTFLKSLMRCLLLFVKVPKTHGETLIH